MLLFFLMYVSGEKIIFRFVAIFQFSLHLFNFITCRASRYKTLAIKSTIIGTLQDDLTNIPQPPDTIIGFFFFQNIIKIINLHN